MKKLPRPLDAYDRHTADKTNEAIESEFRQRRRDDERLVLRSPNGTAFVVSVTDAGALNVTPA